MKLLEILAMGGSLDDPLHSVPGVSEHTSNVNDIAEAWKAHPKTFANYQRAYNAMKSLTQMILHNSSFVGNFPGMKCVRLCRTEEYAKVIDKYKIKPGEIVNYNCGAHESFGVFHTACVHGEWAIFCDVPYSRISSLFFMLNPDGSPMYHALGDNENEGGVNAVGLKRTLWKKVASGIPLTKAYDFVDKVFGTKSPKTAT